MHAFYAIQLTMLSFIDDIFLLIAALLVLGLLIYTVLVCITAVMHTKSKRRLMRENEELAGENKKLKSKITAMEDDGTTKAASPFISFGSLLIQPNRIAYVVSQTFDMPFSGDSRVKVIHYTDSKNTDSVYDSFEGILSKLPDYFLMINKNQIINLHEISKVEGHALYLNNVKVPFSISESKMAEFLSKVK